MYFVNNKIIKLKLFLDLMCRNKDIIIELLRYDFRKQALQIFLKQKWLNTIFFSYSVADKIVKYIQN